MHSLFYPLYLSRSDFSFFILIGFFVLLIFLIKLHWRVKRLESIISSQKATSPSPKPTVTTTPTTHPTSTPSAIPAKIKKKPLSSSPHQIKQSFIKPLTDWLKDDWLLKLGALLIILGFVWLTTYAFMHNWIGPMGRITLGIVSGALIMILGRWRITKYTNQGGVFMVLGSTTIILTIWAAREIYGFFNPISALAIMFFSALLISWASVVYKKMPIALCGLVLASISPLLTATPTPDYIILFSYLLLITAGVVWIVTLTGWSWLPLTSLIIMSYYSLPHWFQSVRSEKEILLLFSFAFSGIIFLTNTVGLIKKPNIKTRVDLITSVGNGLFLLIWVTQVAQKEWQSLLITCWVVIFASGAYIFYKISLRKEPFYVYASVSTALLAAATAIELEGATLTIALTIEATLFVLLSYILTCDRTVSKRSSLLMSLPALLTLQSIASYTWRTSALNKDFVVLALFSAALFGLGYFFSSTNKNKLAEENKLPHMLYILASIYAYILLWLSLHAELNRDTATTIALIAYTIVGLIAYFYGQIKSQKTIYIYGGIMLGIIVGRLLLIDIWDMPLSWRIVAFFMIGTLLASTAFIGRKYHNKIFS